MVDLDSELRRRTKKRRIWRWRSRGTTRRVTMRTSRTCLRKEWA